MEQQGDHILLSPLPLLPFKRGYVFLVILKYCNPRNDHLKSGSFPGTPVYIAKLQAAEYFLTFKNHVSSI